MDTYTNKLAFYSRDKKLYILIIDNINGSTNMVYFKNHEAYRLKIEPTFGQYETAKTTLSNFPIGIKIDKLPGGKAILLETIKYSNISNLLQSEKLRQWLANRFNYESQKKKLETLIENKIRKILKEQTELIRSDDPNMSNFNTQLSTGDKLKQITTGLVVKITEINNGIVKGIIIENGYEPMSQLGKDIEISLKQIGNKYKILQRKVDQSDS